MAEQTLHEFVMNLINWIESLHEKNLKYESQVKSLEQTLLTLESKLAEAQNSKEKLEAQLQTPACSYQQTTSDTTETTVDAISVAHLSGTQISSSIHHPHHQSQPIYHHQPIATHTHSYVPQPAPYVWTTYETTDHQPTHLTHFY